MNEWLEAIAELIPVGDIDFGDEIMPYLYVEDGLEPPVDRHPELWGHFFAVIGLDVQGTYDAWMLRPFYGVQDDEWVRVLWRCDAGDDPPEPATMFRRDEKVWRRTA